MVDFKKRLSTPSIAKKTNPIEIYETLDRRSQAGPLRQPQIEVLTEWYTNYLNKKDIVLKLHTGEGKTLIGLLILQSRINAGKGPSLYICPNKFLVTQACLEAKKFGISYTTIAADNTIPAEFIDGEKILITHVQKAFNGKSIFGINNNYTHSESIILDDSHACIDSIKKAFTIRLNREDEAFFKIFDLFEEDIRTQGEGTFLEILGGEHNSYLPIPYWSWVDKAEKVLEVLSEHRETMALAFTWPLLKDMINSCTCFISGQFLEITPLHLPIEKFATFHNSRHRILMSATTQDDSFFIKGLGFSEESIKSPITNPKRKWSGEKMLVIPSLIDERLEREGIVRAIAQPFKKQYGIAALVSSFQKAKFYTEYGAKGVDNNNIWKIVEHLKKGNFSETVVFANRYDGIDLPDETCRILVVDGKPFFNSLSDKYEEENRKESDSVNIKIAQRIEQGLGRSVRGEKDYCLILVIGNDLIRFIKGSNTKKYFSGQTRKQIDIGMEIAEMAKNDIAKDEQPFLVVQSLIKQSLERDEGWKEFYKEEMNQIEDETNEYNLASLLSLERKALMSYYQNDYEKASKLFQSIIDSHCDEDEEKGWYLQLLARSQYSLSKSDSNRSQKSAFRKNHGLMVPREGISYEKLEFINEDRIKRIKNWIKNGTIYSFDDLMLKINEVDSNLKFGTSAEQFEEALKDLGIMLGFLSERPDKEIKKGPDNLWCGVNNHYFLFECKSQVNTNREVINKSEASQMNTHCAWFDSEYKTSSVTRVLVIPTKTISHDSNFAYDIKILRPNGLRKIKVNMKSFFKEFKVYQLDSISDTKVQELLVTHQLDLESLQKNYFEEFRVKR
ncbi:DEAD/DEAH box helicase family protein [Roseivirga sp. E12]|uniref:DEAD/DEAH box helicase family protein n=1 Tax=Roseivirga sp. E12 TaxID=2819237 RepID=UPI001ABD2142|nr:DEAD/DEAH box helicase family protein [Roseivirga sp. E12]MBO3697575.1 DEAD/DEAH box helicase family protein [Roseivirga sp. E12]